VLPFEINLARFDRPASGAALRANNNRINLAAAEIFVFFKAKPHARARARVRERECQYLFISSRLMKVARIAVP